MLIDPWSVSSEAIDGLAAQFFALSLFPYLGFLYFLNKEEVKCPPLVNFGFRFLLVFVFATIPAGIYAKIHFHDILANIDWLHGSAESLLTITNLFIVLGFRDAEKSQKQPSTSDRNGSVRLSAQLIPILLLAIPALHSFLGSAHIEPTNALSLPTWIIHISSLIEWLVAMGLAWRYADISSNQKWKGLTWGMIPLHTSGICACTYHFFYNAPALNGLVLLQAFLTFFGNTTMAFATFRIYKGSSGLTKEPKGEKSNASLLGFEDLAGLRDSNSLLIGKVFLLSAFGSALVKWGELFFDAPFDHSLLVALAIIFIPTGFNILKWIARSEQPSS